MHSASIRSFQANAVRSSTTAAHPEGPGELSNTSPRPTDVSSSEYDSDSSCILLNVQSLNPSARSACSWKIPFLESFIKQKSSTNCLPFIALTETWLKPYVHDSQLNIDDYSVHRCDRGTRVGGGVLLYTHQDLHITHTEKLDKDSCQLLMCTSEPSKMIICVLYRPPSAPLDDFQACLSALDGYTDGKDDYDLCLSGDFNFPGLKWDPPMSQTATPSSDLLEAFINTHLLKARSALTAGPKEHNHHADALVGQKKNLIISLKRKAEDQQLTSTQNILTETLSSSTPDLNVTRPKLESSQRDEDFVAYDSRTEKGSRVIIFATKRNLDTLAEVPNWIADGTFYVAPKQ
ncbi:hypothetical protein ACHWQZ_G013045 [Mnemiopsis leidyi]